ncbi:MAG TPA: TonB-dependent receptor [Pyrinomonadaceae bacterium]|nr:TonB-dependent receptor [Pyrinomonadaceae bacterium]
MKRLFSACFSVVVLCSFANVAASPAKKTLATIAGSVNDSNGSPVAGALVSLLKEGADEVVKQIKTDAGGRFSTKVAPGRYGLKAIAQGFHEVVFSSIEVHASQELIYRFNLEPAGSGRTLPELRKDRDDVKWTLRSSASRRSIFQVQEEDAEDIRAVLGNDAPASEQTLATDAVQVSSDSRPQGVIETYFASDSYGSAYAGLNFAIATSASDDIELIFAGQTGLGAAAPERFQALARVRAGDRHRLNLAAEGLRFANPVLTRHTLDAPIGGQFSVRAVDEWIVRDGVVIVLGLDYSRFVGGSSAFSLSPRLGVQFDANARTRFRAAYAKGGDEDQIQDFATFENADVAFTNSSNPVAYVDGQAVMERSHRLEFGVERILDNSSNVEATAFFDTTQGRGIGLLSFPATGLSGVTAESLINVVNQQGGAKGLRVVYTRRLNQVWTASAGYSFGRGQRLSTGFVTADELFSDGFFHSAALQFGAGFHTGTRIRTVLRFSQDATVFAIDPFAGRLGVYDPSLSIQVTQELPSFGLPVRAEAILDARNLMDAQTNTENGEILTFLNAGRRSVRGGISLRF